MTPYITFAGLAAVAALVLWSVKQRPPSRAVRLAFAAFVPPAAAAMVRYITGRGTPFGDFDKAYYPAGAVVFTDPARLYDCMYRDGLCYVNIPIVAAIFTPLSALSLETAHLIFTILGAAAIVVATWLLIVVTEATGWRRYAIVLLVVLNGPLSYSVRLGNLTHVVLAMIVLAVLWLLRGQDASAGGVLALCAIIKPPLLIWLPYFIVRRRWRAAAGMSGCLLAVVGTSVLLFGIDLHRQFLQQYVVGNSSQPIGAFNVQSINGFLVRLTTSGGLTSWEPVTVGAWFRIAQVVLALGVVGLAVVAARTVDGPQTRPARLREYSVVLAVMLVLSPISWTHYYCLLLLPIAAYAGGALSMPRSRLWAAAALMSGVLVSMPVALWVPSSPAIVGALVARILISHYFFGALLLITIAAALALYETRLALKVRTSAHRGSVPAAVR